MTNRRLFGLIGVLAMFLCLTAAPARAGDDPYGSTSTTTDPPGDRPGCGLSVGEGRPGSAVTATVSHVPVGTTVRILFDGTEVGAAAAEEVTANAIGPVVLYGGRALPTGASTATVEVDFTVPARPPGRYAISAVGDTFTAECAFGEQADFAVLAASEEGGGGSLPTTGTFAALMVAVALVLLVVGRAVLAASRRRAAATTDRARHRSTSPT